MLVLIVDDEPAILRSLSRSLERAGHETVLAFSASNGVERIKEGHSFDVVITDFQLGDGCGYDVANSAREAGVRKVIGMSGSDTEGMRASGKFNQVLDKPFDMKELLQAL